MEMKNSCSGVYFSRPGNLKFFILDKVKGKVGVAQSGRGGAR
jgi:hypothetical protein